MSFEDEQFFKPVVPESDKEKVADRAAESMEEPAIMETDQKLREKVDSLINLFCNEFTVEGKENVIEAQKKDPDAKFVIASSHISNLDAPAAIKALGDRFDIQITAESVLFGATPQEIIFRLGGKESFTPLEYRKEKKSERGKEGVFNPDDFKVISEKMKDGKTPWMTIHPFTEKKEMQPSRVGTIYLANKTEAKIIPTALEIKGGSVSLEGVREWVKGIWSRKKGETKATFHIGEAIDLPKIDVNIIESVLEKRARKKRVTHEEFNEFKETHRLLKEQADYVAQVIAGMLPDEQRGVYRKQEIEKEK